MTCSWSNTLKLASYLRTWLTNLRSTPTPCSTTRPDLLYAEKDEAVVFTGAERPSKSKSAHVDLGRAAGERLIQLDGVREALDGAEELCERVVDDYEIIEKQKLRKVCAVVYDSDFVYHCSNLCGGF